MARILIIEDEIRALNAIVFKLEDLGHLVLSTRSEDYGVFIVRNYSIDLVVIESMFFKTFYGLQLIRYFVEKSIHILVISDDMISLEQAKEYWASILQRPLNVKCLEILLENILPKHLLSLISLELRSKYCGR